MSRMLTSLLLLTLAIQPMGPPPDTEVYLAPLVVKRHTVEIGAAVNISNNPGYDNQPAFTRDGSAILFTSVRGNRKPDPANAAATGSDIYRYAIASGQLSQLTNTPESEYSPTVTPDGRHVSVIRVESDGTQRLWQFALDGTGPTLVLRNVKPVGYHVWATDKTLALFVLGQKGQPATLQVANTETGVAQVVASGIGRSIQRIPGGGVSFVSRGSSSAGESPRITVSELNPQTREITPLFTTPSHGGDVDTAWTPDGLLLLTERGELFCWRKGESGLATVNLSAFGDRTVSRLTVSPKGDRIAIVAAQRQ